MNTKGNTPEARPKIPYWAQIQLWGVDLLFVSLLWGQAYGTLLDIPIMTAGPLMLLGGSVWLLTIGSRLYLAVFQKEGIYCEFYSRNAAPLILVCLCASAALLWILFYYVSSYLLSFVAVPACIYALSCLLPSLRDSIIARLMRSIAFALACAVPAIYNTFSISPIAMLFQAPIIYLGLLFFLFGEERLRGLESSKGKASKSSLLVTVGLMLLLIACLSTALQAPYFEQGISYTLVIGCAFVELLARLNRHLKAEQLYALSWPLMALAPLLGIWLFA